MPCQPDAGHPPGVALIGVHFRPPQATRKGWPYYRRDCTGGTNAASIVGPPLAGGLPGARTGFSSRLWGHPLRVAFSGFSLFLMPLLPPALLPQDLCIEQFICYRDCLQTFYQGNGVGISGCFAPLLLQFTGDQVILSRRAGVSLYFVSLSCVLRFVYVVCRSHGAVIVRHVADHRQSGGRRFTRARALSSRAGKWHAVAGARANILK